MAESVIDRLIRRQQWMDRLADFLQKVIGAIYKGLGAPGRLLNNLMHGTAVLGHPLHPAVTDIPIGAWSVGLVLDYLAVSGHLVTAAAGNVALLVGTLVALLAVVTGYTDFHDTFGHERRLALAHGLTMTTVFIVEVVSLILRLVGGPGPEPAAIGLATAGLALALLGSYLGGHVVFSMGTAVNRNAFFEGTEDFIDVGSSDSFAEGAFHPA